jgi:hypothetical protein
LNIRSHGYFTGDIAVSIVVLAEICVTDSAAMKFKGCCTRIASIAVNTRQSKDVIVRVLVTVDYQINIARSGVF